MDWWKEVSKMCLNFTVLTVGTFIYTTLTGRWNVGQCFDCHSLALQEKGQGAIIWKESGEHTSCLRGLR
jgi:hypothetical protein